MSNRTVLASVKGQPFWSTATEPLPDGDDQGRNTRPRSTKAGDRDPSLNSSTWTPIRPLYVWPESVQHNRSAASEYLMARNLSRSLTLARAHVRIESGQIDANPRTSTAGIRGPEGPLRRVRHCGG